MLVLLVNITAAAGAFIFGSIQDRIGHIPTIAVTLIGWIIMVLLAWKAEGRAMFWLAANVQDFVWEPPNPLDARWSACSVRRCGAQNFSGFGVWR